MAYIAPSLWAVNQYGEGLRGLVRRAAARPLDRLQIVPDFRRRHHLHGTAVLHASRATASDGGCAEGERADMTGRRQNSSFPTTPFLRLANGDGDRPGTGTNRATCPRHCRDLLTHRSRAGSSSYLKPAPTPSITSRRLGNGRYKGTPEGKGASALRSRDRRHDYEPAGLRPGSETVRGAGDSTPIFCFLTNETRAVRCALFRRQTTWPGRFPKAWGAPVSMGRELAWPGERQDGFVDEDWWGYVYLKNMAKQDTAKLIVPAPL